LTASCGEEISDEEARDDRQREGVKTEFGAKIAIKEMPPWRSR
jgi:hypothetical protein